MSQETRSGPAAHHPLVDIKGTIKQVHIQQGAGMPSVDVETADGTVKLMLGSMRYLMQNNFSPKAGEAITAKALKESTHSLAISVELPASGKSLKLRDENGKPLWRGGMMHGQGDSGMGKGGKGGGKA
jgi:hypothetical protein